MKPNIKLFLFLFFICIHANSKPLNANSKVYFSPDFLEGKPLIKILKSNGITISPPKDYYFILDLHLNQVNDNFFGLEVGTTDDLKGALNRAKEICNGAMEELDLTAAPNDGYRIGGDPKVIKTKLKLKGVCRGGVLFKKQNYNYPTAFCKFGEGTSDNPACESLLKIY